MFHVFKVILQAAGSPQETGLPFTSGTYRAAIRGTSRVRGIFKKTPILARPANPL